MREAAVSFLKHESVKTNKNSKFKFLCDRIMEYDAQFDYDVCMSPSVGWLSPRLSFSKDFAPVDLTERKEKMVRDVLPEFEFTMSTFEDEGSHGVGMLAAADELFSRGKLLPLYVPQYVGGAHPKTERKEPEIQYEPGNRPTALRDVINHDPGSPKPPNCSMMLRELLGLKKEKSEGLQETHKQTMRVNYGSRSPLARKAKRFFCRSDDGKAVDVASLTGNKPVLAEEGQMYNCNGTSCRGKRNIEGRDKVKVRPEHRRVLSLRRDCYEGYFGASWLSGSGRRVQSGSVQGSPARRLSSGAISPAETSGRWSSSRHSLSGWNSPGKTLVDIYSPGRFSVGDPFEYGGRRLLRARSLERSGSYSPKSLQRKYDQLKAMRQRDGWRIFVEYPSASSLNSVRVAPVLNVPVVCSTRSKNTASMTGGSSGGGGTLDGSFGGLGQLSFPVTKASGCSKNTCSQVKQLKRIQSKAALRQLPSVKTSR